MWRDNVEMSIFEEYFDEDFQKTLRRFEDCSKAMCGKKGLHVAI